MDSATNHRGVQVKLTLTGSPTTESEPPVSPSSSHGQTVQPPPSSPNGSLSSLVGKVGIIPIPPQVIQDLPDFSCLELGSGQGEEGAGSEPGEVVSPPHMMVEAPSFPGRTGSYQSSPAVVCPPLFLNESRGWSPPFPQGRRWLGLPRCNCHSVAG